MDTSQGLRIDEPIRGNDGSPRGVVPVVRDLQVADEHRRERDEYLSMVSHELRTPLGHIKGYATTLLVPGSAWDAAIIRHCLEIIVGAVDELEVLVDSLLDMSMIGARLLDVEVEPRPLESLVATAVVRLHERLGRHTVAVRVPESLPMVLVDPPRIGQVFDNLLQNAIKYSPEGGQIMIRAEAVANQLRVSIADEGIGIPMAEHVRLFQPFQRGALARSLRIGGNGLGLAISRGIVEAHGGQIWAESPAPGRPLEVLPGTVIHFTLPSFRPSFGESLPAPDVAD